MQKDGREKKTFLATYSLPYLQFFLVQRWNVEAAVQLETRTFDSSSKDGSLIPIQSKGTKLQIIIKCY